MTTKQKQISKISGNSERGNKHNNLLQREKNPLCNYARLTQLEKATEQCHNNTRSSASRHYSSTVSWPGADRCSSDKFNFSSKVIRHKIKWLLYFKQLLAKPRKPLGQSKLTGQPNLEMTTNYFLLFNLDFIWSEIIIIVHANQFKWQLQKHTHWQSKTRQKSAKTNL